MLTSTPCERRLNPGTKPLRSHYWLLSQVVRTHRDYYSLASLRGRSVMRSEFVRVHEQSRKNLSGNRVEAVS